MMDKMKAKDNSPVNESIHQVDEGIRQWMFQEKVRMLYDNQTQSWVISLFASAIIAYLSISSNNIIAGFSWWLMFVLVTLVRTWNTQKFCHAIEQRSPQGMSPQLYQKWFKRFFILTAIAGFGWGVGGFIVGAHLETLEQVYVFIVLVGVGAAATPLLGVVPRVMLVFQALSSIPYVFYISWVHGEKGFILLFMFALYMLAVIGSMRRMDKNLTHSMTLQYENSQMVDTLSESNQKLQNANEKLETLTLEDALTGLHNRRYFEMQLEAEWKRELREQKVLTLMVIDIDYFKLYNDTYGHAEGDVCLQQVAQILSSCLQRPADVIARIGGEEFVVLLPDAPEGGALELAEQMLQRMSDVKIHHATSPLADYVTVSIGMASVVPGGEATALSLFKAADKALYKAKSKGRNQIQIGEMDLALSQSQ